MCRLRGRPKGQGNPDKNNGHDCDGNKGVGKGNPAHAGCEPTSHGTPPPSHTTPTTTPSATVLGEQITRPEASTATPVAQAVKPAGLAFTGSHTAQLLAIGLLLVVAGAGLVQSSRAVGADA